MWMGYYEQKKNWVAWVIWRLKRSEGGGFVFRKPVDRFIFDIEELLPLYEKEGVVISRLCSWTVPRGRLLSFFVFDQCDDEEEEEGKERKDGTTFVKDRQWALLCLKQRQMLLVSKCIR